MASQSAKPLTLYTFGTPNGTTVSIYLEELKAAYGGPDYETVKMSIRDADIGKVHNQVKSPWFLEINPNGRIPAITHEGFNVFETSAILDYLAQQFDKENKFTWNREENPKEYSEQLQWVYFTHGGVGPMMGQAGHFSFAAEKIPYAINRYTSEVKRLFSVLESRLKDRDYLAGPGRGKYALADIKTFTWVRNGAKFGFDMNEYPGVSAWIERIDARPAVKAGLAVPASD